MKYILILLASLFIFTTCKPDRIDHTDKTYIYVWEYKLNGDSILYKYHQPIYHKTRVTDKDGEDLYIYFNLYGECRHTTAGDFYKYCSIKKGDIITVKEQFYPYYHLYVIK